MVTTEPVTSAKDSQRVDMKQIFWIWLGLTVLLVLFSLWVPARLMGPPASPTMRDVEQTMTVFSLAASPVAALVWAVSGYCCGGETAPGCNRPRTVRRCAAMGW
jgi:hypothetical protein